MNEYIAFTTGVDATRSVALSARPNAPVVAEADHPAGRSRTWTAARLHAFAQATHHLANRVDPVCVAQ